MPQPYRGRRVKMTIRLPADVYDEAAARAAARRWNMSTYVGWCVEKAHNPIGVAHQERRDPALEPSAAALRSRRRREQWKDPSGHP